MGTRYIRTPTGIIRYDNNFTDEQKDKLKNVEYGAQVNTILGIKGSNEIKYRIGYIEITKDNIGLGLVDNTPDKDKNVYLIEYKGSFKNRKTYYLNVPKCIFGYKINCWKKYYYRKSNN